MLLYPVWFPKSKKDLDVFANKVLEAGKELKSGHPVSLTTKGKNAMQWIIIAWHVDPIA